MLERTPQPIETPHHRDSTFPLKELSLIESGPLPLCDSCGCRVQQQTRGHAVGYVQLRSADRVRSTESINPSIWMCT